MTGIRRTGTVVLCAAGLVVPLLTAGPTASASTPSFARISESGIGDTAQQPSIARFGNTYEAVWVHKSGTGYDLRARILTSAGAATGSVISVVSGWGLIRDFPTILTANGTRVIAFDGYENTGVGANALDYPAEYYVASADGLSWSPPHGYLSPGVSPNGADGAVAAMGTSTITALSTADHVSYQTGVAATLPSTWTGTTDNTGNFAQYPGVAVSGSNAWISWLSDSNTASGLFVQPVLPSLGTRKRAPSSLVNNAYPSTHQRIPLVVPTGTSGPPYTAYARPDGLRVFVWRYGATSPITVASTAGANDVELTTAPAGRLWVFWTDSNGWHATRSNMAATRFGPITTIPYPNAAHLSIAGVGSAGPLEALAVEQPAFDGTTTAVFAAQIKPRLSCSASPTSGSPGTKIAVTVKDAGDPVSGATVHFAGKTATTNTAGVVHFTIPSGSPGKLAVSASHSGYAGCSTTVRRT